MAHLVLAIKKAPQQEALIYQGCVQGLVHLQRAKLLKLFVRKV